MRSQKSFRVRLTTLPYSILARTKELRQWEGVDDWMNPPHSPVPPSRAEEGDEFEPNDFRFCYLGPSGTFTPLHRDVYASYSWSANIVGRKEWYFFPPERLMGVTGKDGDMVFDVRELEAEGGGIRVIQEVCLCASFQVVADG